MNVIGEAHRNDPTALESQTSCSPQPTASEQQKGAALGHKQWCKFHQRVAHIVVWIRFPILDFGLDQASKDNENGQFQLGASARDPNRVWRGLNKHHHCRVQYRTKVSLT